MPVYLDEEGHGDSELDQQARGLSTTDLTVRCSCSREMIRSGLRKEPDQHVYTYGCKRCSYEIEVLVPSF